MQLGVHRVERLGLAAGLAQRRPQRGRPVAGDADQAALLVERPADGLADPERRIGRELEAAAPVELVDGVLEAEVALLDEVAEVHALGEGVAAGDADDEPQVGADEAVLGPGAGGDGPPQLGAALARLEALGRGAAVLDGAGQLLLLVRVEEGHLADLVEVHTDGITHCREVQHARRPGIIPPHVGPHPTMPAAIRSTIRGSDGEEL